jgi:hypothetical protein
VDSGDDIRDILDRDIITGAHQRHTGRAGLEDVVQPGRQIVSGDGFRVDLQFRQLIAAGHQAPGWQSCFPVRDCDCHRRPT